MKYTAKLPDDSVNISRENPLKSVFKLSIALAVIAFAAYFVMGFVINAAVSSVTPEQEAKLEKLLSFNVNISETNSSYLVAVTQKLAKCADLPYNIRIRIMEDKEPNAFAVPGGWIYITRGILDKMESENELAFIIGHELGHFKNRDHLRALGYKLVFGMIGLMIGSDYGATASMTLNIGSSRHSQSAELEADAFGLEVMHCAYGTVTGATKLFEKMDKGGEWKYFMATHPGFKERVKKMKKKSIEEGYDASSKPIPLGKI
ncbi:MAG: M48 family metalloprotease [Sulfurovum sp.]|nr:M48 family metalloprotease [Sulfurovum sp.]